ncbi:MAG: sensor histidine kinase [Candidatus Paceibacterota bacterium]
MQFIRYPLEYLYCYAVTLRSPTSDPIGDTKDGHILSRAIIDTIREPLVALSGDLRVIVASRSFYEKFEIDESEARGKLFYDLADGQWNIPALRTLLEEIIPQKTTVEGYEIEHEFPRLGRRKMLVNAREIIYTDANKELLLSFLDVTEQRALEEHRAQLMRQKDTLLKEMRHRIANSLQMIASIILLKAETVQSEESRLHLQDAHDRILSIATVQRNLDPTGDDTAVPVVSYLKTLSESVAKTMIGGRKPITLSVSGDKSEVEPDDAIALGLITTELVINALKHAFPKGEGAIHVTYGSDGAGWDLSIADDGVGLEASHASTREGLGTSIVESLANQLHAQVKRESSSRGTVVSIVCKKR